MKRIISIILVAAMLITSGLGSAEGALKLPANLIKIEDEAFSGNSSLTVADIPYGTESISSRAFADSALEKIYIPRTVSSIAADAFAGTDVLISAPDFSYAQTYAQQHGFEWEDCGDHYPLNVVDTAADILNSGFILDDTELPAPELLPTEGETDPERLELIAAHNALVLEERDLIAACNDTSALTSAAEELGGALESFSIEETGGGVQISLGSAQLTLDSSLYGQLQAGVSFTDAQLSEDGTIKLMAGNKEYTLNTSGNTITLSAPGDAAGTLYMYQSLSASPVGDWIFNKLDEYLATVNNGIAAMDYYIQLNLEDLEKCLDVEKFLHEYKWKLGLESEGVYANRVGRILDKINALNKWSGILDKFSIPAQIASGYLLIEKWNKLNEIDAHGHPTENDLRPEARERSEWLKKEIVSLRGLYATDAANTMMGLATSVLTLMLATKTITSKLPPKAKEACAALTAGSAICKLISFLGGFVLVGAEALKESLIQEIDRSLHTTVSGKVYDAATKLPLQYVSVICGGENVWTDSTGAYTIYVHPGSNTITFKRDDYQDHEISVTLESGDALEENIELTPAEMTITGVIRDSESNTPLPNVTILCGDRMVLSSYDGSYSITLPTEPQTITYLLDGYVEKTATLTMEDITTPVQDIQLDAYTPESSFSYVIDNGEVTITHFVGSETAVFIPDKIKGYPVTCIDGIKAYENLTSVIIPDSVTEIRPFAFYHCTSLKSVTIPDSVTEIAISTFQMCESLMSVTIPDSVTKIGESAFDYCKSLTSLSIGSNVTEIGNYAFSDCYSLTSVTIPDSVTEIGHHAFCRCTGLTSVTIGNSVTKIDEYTFSGCTSLTSVSIPDSVTEIGMQAFSSCTGLTSATLGNSVTEIGHMAFYGCTNLTSVTIGNGVKKIGSRAFMYCSRLTSVTIPDSVTEIGTDAFYECTGLTSVIIGGNGMTEIGSMAFDCCTSLSSVTIRNGVKKIGSYAFSSCTSLTSVTIPDSVTEIGRAAFYNCYNLTSAIIGNGVTYIDNAFNSYYLKTAYVSNQYAANYFSNIDGVQVIWI